MHKDLLADDPHCALTKTALRRLVVTGAIQSTRVGQKYLVSREAVEAFMETSR
ncbi:excisionase family DNA-binding protein [uncultured Oscillibacter sp.]